MKNTVLYRAFQCLAAVSFSVLFIIKLTSYGESASRGLFIESIIYLIAAPVLFIISILREKRLGRDIECKRGETENLATVSLWASMSAVRILIFGESEFTVNSPWIDITIVSLFAAVFIIFYVVPLVILIVSYIRKRK